MKMKLLAGVLVTLIIIVIIVFLMPDKPNDMVQHYTAAELFEKYKTDSLDFVNPNSKLILEGIIDSLSFENNRRIVYMFINYESEFLRGVKIEMANGDDLDLLMNVKLEGYFSKRSGEWLVIKNGKTIEKNNESTPI